MYAHQFAAPLSFWRHTDALGQESRVSALVQTLCAAHEAKSDTLEVYLKYVGMTKFSRAHRLAQRKGGSDSVFSFLLDPSHSVNLWVGDQSVHDRKLCLDAEAVWGELLCCSWEDGSGANRVVSRLVSIDLFLIVQLVYIFHSSLTQACGRYAWNAGTPNPKPMGIKYA